MRRKMIAVVLLLACDGSDGPAEPAGQDTGALRGQVLAAADSAVAGVSISVQRTGQTTRTATTNASGSYTVAGLATGTWTVTATPITGYEANGSLTANVQVAANQTVAAPVLRLRRTTTPPPPPPNFVAVTIADNSFSPASVTVAAGGTVRWTNNGQAVHNTTASGLWASPNLSNGGTFERVFPSAGTFQYVCTLHAGMSGTVVVQ